MTLLLLPLACANADDTVGVAVASALWASERRPTVGTAVELVRAGGTPGASIAWSGVDRADGARAWVTPTTPGPHVVGADGAEVVLDVQGAGNAPPPPPVADRIPRPDVRGEACADDRFPAVASGWLLDCADGTQLDRASRLDGRTRIRLEQVVPGVGVGSSWLDREEGRLRPGIRGVTLWGTPGGWTIPGESDSAWPSHARPGLRPVAIAGVSGDHIAVPLADGIDLAQMGDVTGTRVRARPLPGQAVARGWGVTAWVERHRGSGEDVWWMPDGGRPAPLADTPAQERRVVGDGAFLAWVDDGDVRLQGPDGSRRRLAADAGFAAPLTLDRGVACWEDRAALVAGTGDVDVRCSDGMRADGPGDQRHPSRSGPWLLWREGGQVWLAHARELVLEDDDPRAETPGRRVPGGHGGAHSDAPVRWAIGGWEAGWRVQRWTGSGWGEAEALPAPGPAGVVLEDVGGDAVRLTRSAP